MSIRSEEKMKKELRLSKGKRSSFAIDYPNRVEMCGQ